jgi:DNA mismatch repair protein MSH5
MLCSEKEIEIVYDMAQRILQYETVLVEASDICGELDRYFLLIVIYEPILTFE